MSTIEVAMAIDEGFTIPVERPRNKENRWKLIEKKREMDLIHEMIQTKRIETSKIEYLEKKRQEALEESEKFLSQDIKNFVDFFKKNTSQSKEAMQEAENKKNIRMGMHKEFLEKKDAYQKLVSNINKNAELLEEYNKYKVFLDNVKSANTGNQEANNKEEKKQDKKKSTEQKEDNLLKSLNIKKEIIDLIEDDTFKYEIAFENPDDLIENFTTLEEKNLFLIQQTQEAEQAYEEKNHLFQRSKKRYENEIKALGGGLTEVNERIGKINGEIEKDQEIDSRKKIPEELEYRIREKVKEIYSSIFKGQGKHVESNNSTLYLLSEIEK
mmetsp:Transcript_36845/g.36474  ORF Transcript_36845/g.36474 Transcript_36845/m.36474 type:complete len:326 (+) Transcript_36845:315-1292(+)